MRTKYDIRDKNPDLPTALANSSNRSQARRTEYRMQVSNTFTINFMFCPSKANSWRFKGISCNKLMANYRGVKTLRGDMQITAETMQTYDL